MILRHQLINLSLDRRLRLSRNQPDILHKRRPRIMRRLPILQIPRQSRCPFATQHANRQPKHVTPRVQPGMQHPRRDIDILPDVQSYLLIREDDFLGFEGAQVEDRWVDLADLVDCELGVVA